MTPLVEGSDGNFYGTTQGGGAFSSGTVFRVTPAGVLTVVHSFDQQRRAVHLEVFSWQATGTLRDD